MTEGSISKKILLFAQMMGETRMDWVKTMNEAITYILNFQ